MGSKAKRTVTVKLTIIPPDEGTGATPDEIREAIEAACADMRWLDMDVANGVEVTDDDGQPSVVETETWTVDEATAIDYSE